MNDYLVIARVESFRRDSVYATTVPYTDNENRFVIGKTVYIELFGQMKQLLIEDAVREKSVFFIKFKSFDAPDECQILLKKFLYIPESEAVSLDEHSFFVHDLIGSQVVLSDGPLGTIKDVMLLPANDVYVVETPKGELLIPALKQIISSFSKEDKILSLSVGRSYFDYAD